MKTAEEIKKGMEWCSGNACSDDCPYYYTSPECSANMCRDALAYIQQLESQVPKWISVKERLPEKSGYYLCWMPKYETMDKVHYSAKHMAFNAFDTTCIPESVISVTHWRPLPEPPKGEEHATD